MIRPAYNPLASALRVAANRVEANIDVRSGRTECERHPDRVRQSQKCPSQAPLPRTILAMRAIAGGTAMPRGRDPRRTHRPCASTFERCGTCRGRRFQGHSGTNPVVTRHSDEFHPPLQRLTAKSPPNPRDSCYSLARTQSMQLKTALQQPRKPTGKIKTERTWECAENKRHRKNNEPGKPGFEPGKPGFEPGKPENEPENLGNRPASDPREPAPRPGYSDTRLTRSCEWRVRAGNRSRRQLCPRRARPPSYAVEHGPA